MTLTASQKSSPTPAKADGAADARLLAQRLYEAVQVGGERSGQRVGLPLVLFPVDDDREVRLTHTRFRHCTSMLRTEECCQIATRGGGKIADQAGSGGIRWGRAGVARATRRIRPAPIRHTEEGNGAY